MNIAPVSGERHPTAIIGFQPMQSAAFARPVQAWPMPLIGERVVIGPHAILYCGSEIGDDTAICPRAHIREGAKIGRKCVVGVGVKIGFDAKIGDNVQIMDDAHISGGTVIGDNCFISVGVIIVNDDKPRGYQWKGITPVIVEDDVVIGAGAVIRPGVRIGKGATIAAGAVVTKDVEPGAVIKGLPSRPVVKFDWPINECTGAGLGT
jgi:acetyltransferase-like isoleucine patch superfamily enzyme